MGFRELVPVLFLHLGKLQECYDFIRWWASANPDTLYEAPYLHLKGEDMTESIEVFERNGQLHHVAALTYIKLTLAQALADERHGDQVAEHAEAITPVARELKKFLASKDLKTEPTDRHALQKKLETQAKKAFKLTHAKNAYFWKMMMDLYEVGGKDFAPDKPGDPGEVVAFLTDNAKLWEEDPIANAFVMQQLRELHIV